jgi:ABC-2 type transport system ATP-binding protein
VDRIDLEVPRGSFYGFLGPNGAGKSTTIAMLTGLLEPTSGEARILGLDLGGDSVRIKGRIGVVPEHLALFERLTGREQLLLTGRLYGVPREELHRRADQLLDFMQLSDAANTLIVEYSHGMKKKLALSAALIHRPEALFLDEPFEGIDAVATRAIREVLLQLVRRGMTIFLTSHVLEIVERLCDRVGIIHRGKLIAQGTLEELKTGVALENGGDERSKLTLEEIFLGLVSPSNQPQSDLSWLTG